MTKRLLAALGTAVIAAGLIGLAPTAANAAKHEYVKGDLKLPSGYEWGSVGVYTAGCSTFRTGETLQGERDYRLRVKPGRYRVVFDSDRSTSKARYGFSSLPCARAPLTTVKKGKTTKRNLTVKAKGAVYVTNAGASNGSKSIKLYDVKAKKYVKWFARSTRAKVYPGSYKLVRTVWSDKHRKTVVAAVFGTKSKSLSKGKTIKVVAGKALKVNFGKGKAVRAKDFSYLSEATISGTATLGETLTVSMSKFPKGTSFTYQWFRNDYGEYGEYWNSHAIRGATDPSYVVTAEDADNPNQGPMLSVQVKATKPGYLAGKRADSIVMGATAE